MSEFGSAFRQRRRRKIAVVFFLAAAGLVLGSCAGDTENGSVDSWGNSGAAVSPFVPQEMRIFPLTHVERAGESGKVARVVAHVEFVDRWFDTCKAIGKLELELYRPKGGLNPGVDVRAARWEIDLTDLRRNAEWFDPVTRTYRIQLDLPADLDVSPGGTFRLRAAYSPVGASGGGGVLKDEFVLRL